MLDVGRVCLKTAGRESGKIVVIVKKIDDNFVVIDGNVKRRRCNISHLEPSEKILKIKNDDTTLNVYKAMESEKIKIVKRKSKKEKKVQEKKKEVKENKGKEK